MSQTPPARTAILFELVERAQASAMETLDEDEALQRETAQDRLRTDARWAI
jgi:hypothetical protein